VKTLEEVTYDAGRAALAEQEAFVAGIRQRTGTLLAAHALVASLLGGASVGAGGIGPWELLALIVLLLGLGLGAVLLGPWPLRFAVDARDLYRELRAQAAVGTGVEPNAWLVGAGFGYQALRDRNAPRVRLMSHLCAALAGIVVFGALCWLLALLLTA
jgi:hypothetical protein